MDYPKAITPSYTAIIAAKISAEPGFGFVDLTGQSAINIPGRTSGLLAFIYFNGEWEIVIKLMMLDDLAQGFLENFPRSARANRIALLTFPAIEGFADQGKELTNRMKLYGELTKKYQVKDEGKVRRVGR